MRKTMKDAEKGSYLKATIGEMIDTVYPHFQQLGAVNNDEIISSFRASKFYDEMVNRDIALEWFSQVGGPFLGGYNSTKTWRSAVCQKTKRLMIDIDEYFDFFSKEEIAKTVNSVLTVLPASNTVIQSEKETEMFGKFIHHKNSGREGHVAFAFVGSDSEIREASDKASEFLVDIANYAGIDPWNPRLVVIDAGEPTSASTGMGLLRINSNDDENAPDAGSATLLGFDAINDNDEKTGFAMHFNRDLAKRRANEFSKSIVIRSVIGDKRNLSGFYNKLKSSVQENKDVEFPVLKENFPTLKHTSALQWLVASGLVTPNIVLRQIAQARGQEITN